MGAWLRWGLMAVGALAVILVVGRVGGQYVQDFVEWVQGMGSMAPVIFMAGYALATVAFIPGSILSLAGGAIFGVGWGLLFVMVGATAGSTAAFLAGRYVARDWVRRRTAGDPRFQALDRSIGRQGLKLVFLVRLTPILPYNFLNYALGLTPVRLPHFVVASAGMIPGALLYVYSGWLAGDIATAVGEEAVTRGPGYYAVLALGLVATVALVVVVTRMARAALQEEVGEDVAPPEEEGGVGDTGSGEDTGDEQPSISPVKGGES